MLFTICMALLVLALHPLLQFQWISPENFVVILVTGIILGLSTLHINWNLRRPIRVIGGHLAPRQERHVLVQSSFDQLRHRCLTALKEVGALKIRQKSISEFSGRTRSRWFFWHEDLSLKLKPLGDNQFDVEILSAPFPGETLFDEGHGWKNAETLATLLKTPKNEPSPPIS